MRDWARYDYEHREHHRRYVQFVEGMDRPLTCQECGGMGGEVDIIHPEIGGPWEDCYCCEGTGLVTPHYRGQWLRWKKEDKRERASDD